MHEVTHVTCCINHWVNRTTLTYHSFNLFPWSDIFSKRSPVYVYKGMCGVKCKVLSDLDLKFVNGFWHFGVKLGLISTVNIGVFFLKPCGWVFQELKVIFCWLFLWHDMLPTVTKPNSVITEQFVCSVHVFFKAQMFCFSRVFSRQWPGGKLGAFPRTSCINMYFVISSLPSLLGINITSARPVSNDALWSCEPNWIELSGAL